MELLVSIVNQGALTERQIVNKNTGMTEMFATMPFVMKHGSDTFFAEMLQDNARKCGPIDKSRLYYATLQFTSQTSKDKDGNEWTRTRVTVQRFADL